MSKLVMTLLATAAVCAMASAASAASTVYTSRAAFDAATINQQIITFNSDGNGAGTARQYPNSLTTGGVTFTTDGPANTMYVIDTAYNSPNFFFTGGGGPYLNDNNYLGTTTVTATLPANVRAVGADFGLQTTANNSEFYAFVGLSTGEDFSYTLPTSRNLGTPDRPFSFLGFVSDVDISSLTFRAEGKQFNQGSGSLDNFTLAEVPVAEVPEPSTSVVVMLSLVGLGLSGSRRCRHR